MLIFWGIWERAELMLRIWGAKAKHYRGYGNFLSVNTLFSGSKGAQTPGVLNLRTLNLFVTDS